MDTKFVTCEKCGSQCEKGFNRDYCINKKCMYYDAEAAFRHADRSNELCWKPKTSTGGVWLDSFKKRGVEDTTKIYLPKKLYFGGVNDDSAEFVRTTSDGRHEYVWYRFGRVSYSDELLKRILTMPSYSTELSQKAALETSTTIKPLKVEESQTFGVKDTATKFKVGDWVLSLGVDGTTSVQQIESIGKAGILHFPNAGEMTNYDWPHACTLCELRECDTFKLRGMPWVLEVIDVSVDDSGHYYEAESDDDNLRLSHQERDELFPLIDWSTVERGGT